MWSCTLIANIFASETDRPLRVDHHGLTLMPSKLSTNNGVLAVEEYADLVREFCSDHNSVSQKLRDVPSPFNPIKGSHRTRLSISERSMRLFLSPETVHPEKICWRYEQFRHLVKSGFTS